MERRNRMTEFKGYLLSEKETEACLKVIKTMREEEACERAISTLITACIGEIGLPLTKQIVRKIARELREIKEP